MWQTNHDLMSVDCVAQPLVTLYKCQTAYRNRYVYSIQYRYSQGLLTTYTGNSARRVCLDFSFVLR